MNYKFSSWKISQGVVGVGTYSRCTKVVKSGESELTFNL